MIKLTVVIQNIIFWEDKLKMIKKLAPQYGVRVLGYSLIQGVVFKDLEIRVSGNFQDVENFINMIQEI